jgi:hypothetical protein
MNGDLDLHGVYLPPLLAWACIALPLSLLLQALLRRIGAYRLVWHAPLFNLALSVILLGLVAAVSNWILA